MDRATKRLEDKQDMLVNIMQKTFQKARNLHFRMKSKEIHIRANRLHEIAFKLRELQKEIDEAMKEATEERFNGDDVE